MQTEAFVFEFCGEIVPYKDDLTCIWWSRYFGLWVLESDVN